MSVRGGWWLKVFIFLKENLDFLKKKFGTCQQFKTLNRHFRIFWPLLQSDCFRSSCPSPRFFNTFFFISLKFQQVYLYQNLYAQLPVTLEAFVADLSEMFPAGIFDTKYLADYVCRTPSSFLEFVFKTLWVVFSLNHFIWNFFIICNLFERKRGQIFTFKWGKTL